MLTHFNPMLPLSPMSPKLIQCTQKPDSQFTDITSDWSQCESQKNNSTRSNSKAYSRK